MTTHTLPKLTQAQWRTLADIAEGIHGPYGSPLDKLNELGLVASEYTNNRLTFHLTPAGENTCDAAAERTLSGKRTPGQICRIAVIRKPREFLFDADRVLRIRAIRTLAGHIGDDDMARLANDPDTPVRAAAAEAATDSQKNTMFEQENAPSVIRELGNDWMARHTERIIASGDPDAAATLLLYSDGLDAGQLSRIVRTHLTDATAIASRLIRTNESPATTLSDDDLDEIARHGDDAAHAEMIANCRLSDAARRAVVRNGGLGTWAKECGPLTARRIIRLNLGDMDDLGATDGAAVSRIIRILVDRHIDDRLVIDQHPSALDDRMIDSIIRNGDPDAVEALGGLRHAFTRGQTEALYARSRAFAARVDNWRASTGLLFADADTAKAMLEPAASN